MTTTLKKYLSFRNFDLIKCLSRPASTKPFAFLRIATGLVALGGLLVLSANWKDIYGSQGYIEWVISSHLFSMPNLPTMAVISSLVNPEVVSDDMIMYGVLSLYISALAGLTIGFKPNLMAFLAWILHLTINNTANMYGYGVETFIHVSLFYLIFMPCSHHWTLFGKNKPVSENTPAYANLWMIILQVHLCIVYFNAGIAKIEGDDWVSGEALWRSVAQPSYGQTNMFWLARVPWISFVSTYMVLILETAYPLFIWFKFSRLYWLIGIIFMHIGIALFMGLYAFSSIMIVINVAAFGWDYVESLSRYLKFKLRWTRAKSLVTSH